MMVMVGQIRELETEIAQALRAHPDGEIFQSIFLTPDAVICAATLLSEIDDSRPRCSHRDATQERAVPVGCNKRLRNALGVLAQSSARSAVSDRSRDDDAVKPPAARGSERPGELVERPTLGLAKRWAEDLCVRGRSLGMGNVRLFRALSHDVGERGCDQCFADLAVLVERQLLRDERVRVAASHLRACPDCREDAEGLRVLVSGTIEGVIDGPR